MFPDCLRMQWRLAWNTLLLINSIIFVLPIDMRVSVRNDLRVRGRSQLSRL
jgi:hypothetical protein